MQSPEKSFIFLLGLLFLQVFSLFIEEVNAGVALRGVCATADCRYIRGRGSVVPLVEVEGDGGKMEAAEECVDVTDSSVILISDGRVEDGYVRRVVVALTVERVVSMLHKTLHPALPRLHPQEGSHPAEGRPGVLQQLLVVQHRDWPGAAQPVGSGQQPGLQLVGQEPIPVCSAVVRGGGVAAVAAKHVVVEGEHGLVRVPQQYYAASGKSSDMIWRELVDFL